MKYLISRISGSIFVFFICLMIVGIGAPKQAHAGWWSSATNWVENAAEDVSDFVVDTAEDVADFVVDTAEDVADAFSDFGNDVKDWFEDTGDDINDFADELEMYTDFLKQLTDEGYKDSGSEDFTLVSTSEHSADSGTFDMITFNYTGFPDAMGGIPDEDVEKVSAYIEEWQADIVALQEDWAKNGLLLSGISSESYPYVTDHYRGGPLTLGDGLMTFSKFPFDSTTAKRVQFDECYGTLWEYILGETNSPDCQSEKGFTMVRLQIDNDFELDVYNTHMNTQQKYNTNSPNTAQMAEYINTVSAGRPILFSGDWNSSVKVEDRDEWMQELMDATGMSFGCLDIDIDPDVDYDKYTEYHSCDIDVIGYRGSDKFILTPVQRLELYEDIGHTHSPNIVTFDWERNPDYVEPVALPTELRFEMGELTLKAGECIETQNRKLCMQGDGNLVIRNSSSGEALWSTHTSGSNFYAKFQNNGNLVVKNSSGKSKWSSSCKGNYRKLILQGDGNLVIYNSSGNAKWASGTN